MNVSSILLVTISIYIVYLYRNYVWYYRKDPKQFHNQRLWTNREDCKDEFWAAIRSNYDYIMDTNLIDSCKVCT